MARDERQKEAWLGNSISEEERACFGQICSVGMEMQLTLPREAGLSVFNVQLQSQPGALSGPVRPWASGWRGSLSSRCLL